MKARKVKKLRAGGALDENAARTIRVRLEELRSFAPAARNPENAREQHDMRIAAKRLRYVLEATEFCFGKPGQTARRRARDIQDVLGDLHDCDVMLPRVDAHLAELRAGAAKEVRERAGDADDVDPALAARTRHRTAYRGLEVLAVYLHARRGLLFDRFLDLWAAQERLGTWDALDRSATRVLREAKERKKAARRAEEAERELIEAERIRREAAEHVRATAAELAQTQRQPRRSVPANLGVGGTPEKHQ